MEFASEKRNGGDGAEGYNRDGDVSDSGLVDCGTAEKSQHQDNPPVNGENHECVAGYVAQNAFGNADGGDVGKLACEQKRGDKADNACDGTCDKLGEALAQVVVHDAKIRTWRFQKCVGDIVCYSDGGNDDCVFCGVSCTRRNGVVDFFDGFLAEKTASEEE